MGYGWLSAMPQDTWLPAWRGCTPDPPLRGGRCKPLNAEAAPLGPSQVFAHAKKRFRFRCRCNACALSGKFSVDRMLRGWHRLCRRVTSSITCGYVVASLLDPHSLCSHVAPIAVRRLQDSSPHCMGIVVPWRSDPYYDANSTLLSCKFRSSAQLAGRRQVIGVTYVSVCIWGCLTRWFFLSGRSGVPTWRVLEVEELELSLFFLYLVFRATCRGMHRGRGGIIIGGGSMHCGHHVALSGVTWYGCRPVHVPKVCPTVDLWPLTVPLLTDLALYSGVPLRGRAAPLQLRGLCSAQWQR